MSQPELFIIGGPNGSGKTTIALTYLGTTGLKFLSADSIAAKLNPNDPASAAIAAGRLLSRKLADALSNRESIVLESTLSGLSLKKAIRQARAAGYWTEILFVFLDSPTACLDIKERVARGGHNVTESDVVRRFPRSLKNFWQVYRHMASQWVLYYNGGQSPVRIASGSAKDVVCLRPGWSNAFPEHS